MAVAQAVAGTSQDIQNSQSQSVGRRFAAAVKKFFSPPKEMKLQSESKAILAYLDELRKVALPSKEQDTPLAVLLAAPRDLLEETVAAAMTLEKPSKNLCEQLARKECARNPRFAILNTPELKREFNEEVAKKYQENLDNRKSLFEDSVDGEGVDSGKLISAMGAVGRRARDAARVAAAVKKARVQFLSQAEGVDKKEELAIWHAIIDEEIKVLNASKLASKKLDEQNQIQCLIDFFNAQKIDVNNEVYGIVILSKSNPTPDDYANASYDYYVNNFSLSKNEKEEVCKIQKALLKFVGDEDHESKIQALASFQIRGHRWREAFYVIGKICSILFALGCGFTTAGALMLVLPGMPIVFPVFVFIAGFLVNYALTSQSTPNTFAYLRQMFVEQFLKFSLPKKIFVACSALFCLSAGIVAAVFAYTGAIAIAATLGLVSAAFPPIFMVVAVVSALCIAAVMFRGILAASNGNILEKIRNFFTSTFKPRNLVIRDAWGVEREYPETRGRYIVRMIMTVALSAVFFLVASLGCVFNMYSGYQVLTEMLMKTQLFVMAAAQVLGMLPSIFAALGETQFHAQVAKDNAKTLTVKIPELIQTAKEVLDGRRSANKGLIAARIVLAIVMMKIILLNIIGNAFPAAIGGGMVGGPELSCPLTVMESALDTMDDWLIQMKSVLKGLTIIANAIATAFRSIVDRIKGKKSGVVGSANDSSSGPDAGNGPGVAPLDNADAGLAPNTNSSLPPAAGAPQSPSTASDKSDKSDDKKDGLFSDSISVMSHALGAVAVAHVVTENALEEAMVTKHIEAPVVTISTDVPVSSLSIFKKASVVPANTSCGALELPEALSSAAAVAAVAAVAA